jgi:hypothetical protein
VKGSPGVLICYWLGCTCPAVWMSLSCCPGWGKHITSISLASTELWAAGMEPHPEHKGRSAQKEPTFCIVHCSLCGPWGPARPIPAYTMRQEESGLSGKYKKLSLDLGPGKNVRWLMGPLLHPPHTPCLFHHKTQTIELTFLETRFFCDFRNEW